MYNYVIVTHIPVFYKINLYNELAKELKIYVIFIASNTNEKRSDDFVGLKSIKFDYEILNEGNFQNRSKLKNIKKLNKILKSINYEKLLVSGWDLIEFWYLIVRKSKDKNCLALESTILESNTKGIKGFIKRIFLSRISIVFASGNLHVELLKELNYKKVIKITRGVGIINKPIYTPKEKKYEKKFLFIGRLSKVKNLELLIEIFNELSDYKLTLIGTGEDEEKLKKSANENIYFEGSIPNKKLINYFEKNDVFILPSSSEPWGLVVEEALYYGMPVIVSQNCGSCELIKNEKNGYIIDPNNKQNIKNTILKINIGNYKQMCESIKVNSIREKDILQVFSYMGDCIDENN